MPEFAHLHVHSQYSLLDGAASIKALINKAKDDNMKAVALTDHGNMFGVFNFVAEAAKSNIKPIVGCEFYVVNDRHKRQFDKENKDVRHHQLLLAKNQEGYKNLVKLCSLGFIEGLYSKWPRIDKELILKYHENLIATTCCIGAEIPQAILHKGEEEAEKIFKWWLDMFGDDFYVELQRHNLKNIDGTGKSQEDINQVLLKWAVKYNVKVIATNDSHYIEKDDFNAHDILLCVNTGELQKTPVGDGKGYRFGFPNDEFYFKKQVEMEQLFKDIPQAIDNTGEIVDKVETLKLKQDILLPHFQIPAEFKDQDEYLRHMTYEGARAKYEELTPEIEERLNFELFTIKTMGFAGYFLIVSDFIKAGRDLGVFVGPGRGSAAGSAVAYCIGITNIDPIKYNLLFERFLNPDRKSMPDIDTDFDDVGRQKVIEYVVEKYGKNQVAQIITYGTMAAKMSIKDVARVLDLPLPESNALAKLVPERAGIELARVFKAPIDGEKSLKSKEGLSTEEIDRVKKLRDLASGDDLQAKVLKEAQRLEGSVRNTGIHAAGIIIAPMDLTEIIPVATSKDTDLLITQYDGKIIEDAGVIKMDFLGLKTLTIIRDALNFIRENHDIEIEIDEIPLDDKKTLELYQRGETNGTFQFESAGMQKYLKELKPDKFEDLIAMNALYRPGPLEYIPNFIARKHGKEAVKYDLQAMEEFLQETYGITVYQEQVMLLSQKLANFTKGDADTLRKAMGKKQKEVLDKMKSKFIEGCEANGHDLKICEKVWTDWEAFASYAFNKSHSTCYAFVAFQTAYLKAHYPAEYMAAVLANNMSDIKKVNFFIEESSKMGVKVLGPDVNESLHKFSVNKKGEIRFGLGAIKGVGEAAVDSIITERKQNGPFTDIFDFTRRVNLRAVNKKAIENMAFAGVFDCFEGIDRSRYFATDDNSGVTVIEKAIKYGNHAKTISNTTVQTLFGEELVSDLTVPEIPECEPWKQIIMLQKEKEMLGFYVSGHPLDEYKLEMDNICSCSINTIGNYVGQIVTFGGIISSVTERTDSKNRSMAFFTIEDYTDKIELGLFSANYLKWKHFIETGFMLLIKGKVQTKYNKEDEFTVDIQEINLLADVRETMVNNFTMKLNLQDIDDKFITELKKLITGYPGKCNLNFHIIDVNEKLSVTTPSLKFKVEPHNELIKKLKQLNQISVSIK